LQCLPGFAPLGSTEGGCIKLVSVAKTWSQARSSCQQMGADLPVVKSQVGIYTTGVYGVYLRSCVPSLIVPTYVTFTGSNHWANLDGIVHVCRPGSVHGLRLMKLLL
jgi:hypothetical protein